MYAVIPAGGTGSRLWPRSRRSAPKHMLPLSGSGKPLIEETYDRIAPVADGVYVLTEERQVPMICSLLPELDQDHLIAEPSARGTTNALALAAATLLAEDSEAVMVSVAADHVIRGESAYRRTVERAAAVAQSSRELVAVGLKPTYPATGFGYIEVGGEERFGRSRAHRVERFVEKPALETAERYVADGRHFWNIATFAFRCDVFLEELDELGPEHAQGVRKVVELRRRGEFEKAARLYGKLPVEVVDRTVMERTSRLLMVQASFDWVDVGSWSELADLLRADPDGNVTEGVPVLIDTHNSFISVPDKLVAVIGMDDLIVVDTDDALLVCPKSRAQDVKKVVEQLNERRLTGYL
ncbi:MAG TPA: sugar phosphate nucleotidyltransferase [Candidatus Dormibacteraeota bacterium]|nr:sugar phosphate nucleotidyltransferase [Candidatus Dormibacteraeota bacterium]